MNITWIHKDVKVKDQFGDWVIVDCPDRIDERVGEIEIAISSTEDSLRRRNVWLLDFLRDFEPII